MKLRFAAFALAALPVVAPAQDQSLQTQFYAAAGGGNWGSNFSVGGGTKVDALEISSISLGSVGAAGSARFLGLSLVQNATPVHGFNFLFRIGIGRETTTFSSGATAHRMWFGNGVYFGIGEQYQFNSHLAVRAEVDRIRYAATPDGQATGTRYPATLSAIYIF